MDQFDKLDLDSIMNCWSHKNQAKVAQFDFCDFAKVMIPKLLKKIKISISFQIMYSMS